MAVYAPPVDWSVASVCKPEWKGKSWLAVCAPPVDWSVASVCKYDGAFVQQNGVASLLEKELVYGAEP